MMKTSTDIEATLPELSTEDLHRIECVIHGIYRRRHDRVIYDDAYGIWLEDDQTSAASEVFRVLDEQEEDHAGSESR